MSSENKNILDYVGDDGEFLYPVDEEGEFLSDTAVDYLPPQYHATEIESQPFPLNIFTSVMAVVSEIKRRIMLNMGYLTWIGAVLVFIPILMLSLWISHNREELQVNGVLVAEQTKITPDNNSVRSSIVAGISDDVKEELLRAFDDELPNANLDYRCQATILYGTTALPVYRVMAGELRHMATLSVQATTAWDVFRIDGSSDWYQLSDYYPQKGEGIVLARYFTSLRCSPNDVTTTE